MAGAPREMTRAEIDNDKNLQAAVDFAVEEYNSKTVSRYNTYIHIFIIYYRKVIYQRARTKTKGIKYFNILRFSVNPSISKKTVGKRNNGEVNN